MFYRGVNCLSSYSSTLYTLISYRSMIGTPLPYFSGLQLANLLFCAIFIYSMMNITCNCKLPVSKCEKIRSLLALLARSLFHFASLGGGGGGFSPPFKKSFLPSFLLSFLFLHNYGCFIIVSLIITEALSPHIISMHIMPAFLFSLWVRCMHAWLLYRP